MNSQFLSQLKSRRPKQHRMRERELSAPAIHQAHTNKLESLSRLRRYRVSKTLHWLTDWLKPTLRVEHRMKWEMSNLHTLSTHALQDTYIHTFEHWCRCRWFHSSLVEPIHHPGGWRKPVEKIYFVTPCTYSYKNYPLTHLNNKCFPIYIDLSFPYDGHIRVIVNFLDSTYNSCRENIHLWCGNVRSCFLKG